MTDQADHTIYIRKRQSTLEDDEWAEPMIRDAMSSGRMHGCAIILFGIVASLIALISSGWAALAIGVLFVLLAGGLTAVNQWRDASLLRNQPRPFGTVLTISLPVLDWHRVQAEGKAPATWLARFGDNLFMHQKAVNEIGQQPKPTLHTEALGHRIEMDYYSPTSLPRKSAQGIRLLHIVRSIGEPTDCRSEIRPVDVPISAYQVDGWSRYVDHCGWLESDVPALLHDIRGEVLHLPGSVVDEA